MITGLGGWELRTANFHSPPMSSLLSKQVGSRSSSKQHLIEDRPLTPAPITATFLTMVCSVWRSRKALYGRVRRERLTGLNLCSVRNTPIYSGGQSRIIVWLNITGCGIGPFWFKKWFYLYLVVWPWTCCHSSGHLAFLIKRMGVMVKITRVFVKVKWLVFVGRVQ